jgi:hypothetical protein
MQRGRKNVKLHSVFFISNKNMTLFNKRERDYWSSVDEIGTVVDWLGKNSQQLEEICKSKKVRSARSSAVDYWSTPWGIMLRHADVDHFKFIHYISSGFVGTVNDMVTCRNDPYTIAIVSGLYAGIAFFVFLMSGVLMKCFGAWLIVDGGYPKQTCFQHAKFCVPINSITFMDH